MNQKGLTLVEQMVAAALIGLVIVVWFNATKVQTRGVLLSKNNLRAQNLALSKLEDLRSLALNAGYDGTFSSITNTPMAVAYRLTRAATIEAKAFTWAADIQYLLYISQTTAVSPTTVLVTTTTAKSMVAIQATVMWTDVSGSRQITQTGYVSDPRK